MTHEQKPTIRLNLTLEQAACIYRLLGQCADTDVLLPLWGALHDEVFTDKWSREVASLGLETPDGSEKHVGGLLRVQANTEYVGK